MTANNSKCVRCRFYAPFKTPSIIGEWRGECRRVAPVVFSSAIDVREGIYGDTMFPVVGRDCWCGQFEEREGGK